MERTFLPKIELRKLFSLLVIMAVCSFSYAQADVTRPTVVDVTPNNLSITLNAGTSVSARFSEAMNVSTVSSATFELRNSITNALIPGTIIYSPTTKTVTLYPHSLLTSGLLYTAKVKGGSSGVKDLAGNAMSSDYTWYFLIIPLFDLSAPSILSVAPANGATGVSNSVSVTATFSEKMKASTLTASTVELRNSANTLIPSVVTYNATTRVVTLKPSAPLSAGGVFKATIKGGSSGAKDEANNPLPSNYTWSFTVAAPVVDVTKPTVTSVSPLNAATGVNITSTVSAIFSEAMNASSITTTNVELRKGTTLVTATVAYNATTKTVTLTPSSALAYATVYTATVKGGSTGVKDLAGNTMLANYTWSFTTVAAPDLTKPTVLSVAPVNGTVNVAVSSNVSAVFSESLLASSVNTTTVELRNGTVLVPATVSYNTTTKTVTLDPVSSLASSVVYTAKIKGGTSGVKDLSNNGMVSDYSWSFTTADITAPLVTDVTPEDEAGQVSVSTTVTATFNEAMNAATITASSFELKNSGGATVAGSISYDAALRVLTFTPSLALAYSTDYVATIKGGAAGVKDAAGNPMAANYSWNFTTADVPNSQVVSIFDPTILPAVPAIIDNPVEVGVRFRSSVSGWVTGLKFYKGTGNIGTHIGHLWTNTGTMLGEVTFTDETPSGWQEVLFESPIAISSNVTYVASYYSTAGIYAYTNYYFVDEVSNGPLTALADGQDGQNGVYRYSAAPAFPNSSFNSTNYFVDVMFSEYVGPDVTAPDLLTITPADHATGVAVTAEISAVFNEALDPATVSSSSMELRTSANTLVPSSVTYNSASNTVTLTPVASLANSAVYNVKVKSGASGIKDEAGNALSHDHNFTFSTVDPPLIAPVEGPGGPVLVLSSSLNPFSRYTVEILRAEGLNHFDASDILAINASMLSNYDVIVLGEIPVTSTQVGLLTNWVNAGGTLIAFKPSALLNSLCGLSTASGTLKDKYLLVNTSTGPGSGIVNQTIQFHGTANLHSIASGSGATSIATLYSSATLSTPNPAVTMRTVGANGGKVFAFTYDLSRSIVYTRQGNPEWAGQKRDGQDGPIRSDDLFFGGSGSPDWIDFDKIAIPQADEQQRLLANIIIQGNMHRKPLPRFWYLPGDYKAAVVMTGDDHGNGGTAGRFDQYRDLLPTQNTPQHVADWKAIRGTSYIYSNTPLSTAQAKAYEDMGFEIALHPNHGCLNYTYPALQNTFTTQLGEYGIRFPTLKAPVSNRTHCLTWSDWSSTPKVEAQNGIRFDVNYYYWPEVWMQNRPGMFTGSGLPMRFADMDGTILDVYQAPTQMTDETNMNYTAFCNAVLDKATGPEGYYGVFVANMHTDNVESAGSDAIVASAIAHGVPVISSKQMLTWLDGRNNSSFTNMVWSNGHLNFTATARIDARNLRGMLPLYSNAGQLISVTREGTPVPFTTEIIKGVAYGIFAIAPGSSNYVAAYSLIARTANPAADTTTVIAYTETEAAPVEEKAAEEKPLAPGKLFASALPNPSTHHFNLVINSSDATPVTVQVVDMMGRVIETHSKIASTGILRLGHNWGAGTYFAEVIQGDQRKVIRIVKTN